MFGCPDWIVVRVVVMDRKDGAGDENVLPSPPYRWLDCSPAPVVTVPAFDFASVVLVTVGAMDFLSGVRPSCEIGNDVLLPSGESADDVTERRVDCWVRSCCDVWRGRPERGYG